MVRYLIVNADDFGQSDAVTDGIGRAAADGIVTSATLLCNNGPAAERALRLADELPDLGVGVHLNLTTGPPIARPDDVTDLLGPDGRFALSPVQLLFRSWASRRFREQVRREWDAQVRWFLDHGRRPTHLDSHKHVHAAPALFAVACELADRHGIPAVRLPAESLARPPWGPACPPLTRPRRARQAAAGCALRLLSADANRRALARFGLRSPQRFYGIADTGGCGAGAIEAIVRRLRPGVSELMVHPGLPDPGGGADRITPARPMELAALTAPALRRAIERAGIQLVSYRHFAQDGAREGANEDSLSLEGRGWTAEPAG